MTTIHSLPMRQSIAFHQEFRLDDAFWGIVVGLDTAEASVDVEDANELNEVEVAVVVHDIADNAATELQKVDQHFDCHQLFPERNKMKSEPNYFS